jgi:hypothetical protein
MLAKIPFTKATLFCATNLYHDEIAAPRHSRDRPTVGRAPNTSPKISESQTSKWALKIQNALPEWLVQPSGYEPFSNFNIFYERLDPIKMLHLAKYLEVKIRGFVKIRVRKMQCILFTELISFL